MKSIIHATCSRIAYSVLRQTNNMVVARKLVHCELCGWNVDITCRSRQATGGCGRSMASSAGICAWMATFQAEDVGCSGVADTCRMGLIINHSHPIPILACDDSVRQKPK